jgi:hypothetical protein
MFYATSAGKSKLEGNMRVWVDNIKLDLKETCIDFTLNYPNIRGVIQNIPDWCRQLQ